MTVEIVYLASGEGLPDVDLWMLIEADADWGFLATGAGQTLDGRNVYYSEQAAELDVAIEAAQPWCVEHRIDRIFVQKAL